MINRISTILGFGTICLGALALCLSIPQDSAAERAKMLNTVFIHRVDYLDAQEMIDPCSLLDHVRDTAAFSVFDNWIRKKFVDRGQDMCGAPPGNAFPVRLMRLDSLKSTGPDARDVFLSVGIGEASHLEQVKVLRLPDTQHWVVVEVVSKNFMRYYRRPPP